MKPIKTVYTVSRQTGLLDWLVKEVNANSRNKISPHGVRIWRRGGSLAVLLAKEGRILEYRLPAPRPGSKRVDAAKAQKLANHIVHDMFFAQ